MSESLTLDDLAVGQEFVSNTFRFDAEAIIAFGRQFDPQPFHVDPEAAKDTFFGGLAASGWHTMSVTMRLLVESIPLECGIIGAGGEVSWPKPTRPGDQVHVRTTITEITPSKSRKDRAMVSTTSVTLDESGEVLQTFRARLVVFRKEI